MIIQEILNILRKDKITDDVEVLFSALFTSSSGTKFTNEDNMVNVITRELDMAYPGIILTDKNKHLLTKYNKDVITGDVKLSTIRLDDIFISVIIGELDLETKYKNKCSAVLNTDTLTYSSGEEPRIVLNSIIHIDSKCDNKSMILCHELSHLVIKYNMLMNNMILDFDNILDEEFICDIISCKVNNPYNWKELFEALLENINEEYKEFYKLEYSKLSE